jgi:glycosyltransferase involved in cell wall biosynthesis
VEDMDGIRIVRAGRQWTVHWHAFRHYRKSLRSRFDAVIDEVNTMPFFTPFWARIPTFMLIFQLAREVWWYESPFPISAIGYAIEPMYLMGYRHTPVFTISRSTEQDLRRLGFRGPITLIPIGIERVPFALHAKTESPTFLYVGRLAPSKRIGHILEALAQFRQSTGTGTLGLVGSGSKRYEQSIMKLAKRLNIKDSVVLCGRVSSREKHRMMAEAHALLMTSVREGWGLVVTEANACGTPAIVYDVPGLRDSVRHELTGLVVPPQPHDLSDAMIRLTSDPALYARLAAAGQRWSGTFSFDESARLVGLALQGTLAA